MRTEVRISHKGGESVLIMKKTVCTNNMNSVVNVTHDFMVTVIIIRVSEVKKIAESCLHTAPHKMVSRDTQNISRH